MTIFLRQGGGETRVLVLFCTGAEILELVIAVLLMLDTRIKPPRECIETQHELQVVCDAAEETPANQLPVAYPPAETTGTIPYLPS